MDEEGEGVGRGYVAQYSRKTRRRKIQIYNCKCLEDGMEKTLQKRKAFWLLQHDQAADALQAVAEFHTTTPCIKSGSYTRKK